MKKFLANCVREVVLHGNRMQQQHRQQQGWNYSMLHQQQQLHRDSTNAPDGCLLKQTKASLMSPARLGARDQAPSVLPAAAVWPQAPGAAWCLFDASINDIFKYFLVAHRVVSPATSIREQLASFTTDMSAQDYAARERTLAAKFVIDSLTYLLAGSTGLRVTR
jgi:hypothetical protein